MFSTRSSPDNQVQSASEVSGRRVLMTQRWEDIAFIHWRVDPARLADLLPAGLEPDTHQGKAWVGLVPFRMVGIAPGKGPSIPYFGTFPETNVRTYVIGSEGPGVWFHSLEASRLLPVIMARIGYRLPYFHAAMRLDKAGSRLSYNALRRWPGPRGVGGTIRASVGAPIETPSELDVFLTSRWRLYSEQNGRLYSAEVRHPEWPLRELRVEQWDDELVRVAGYPPTEGEPYARFSDGVAVDVYRPTLSGAVLNRDL